MCIPLAAAAIAASVVSAAGSVIGGIQAKQQGAYQAAVATQNQQLANDQARDALDRGKIAEQQQYRKTAQLEGAQRAAFAANGIDPNSGSAALVQDDTAMIGAQDAATLRQNVIRETKGYEINAANYGAQASAARQAGNGAFVGSLFSAGASILGGVSQFKKLKAEGFGG